MKRFALLSSLLSLRPAVVIGTLPNTISNGQTEDATPVMANFNWIVNQVNAAGLATVALSAQLASANTFTAVQTGVNATALQNFPTATQLINDSLIDCGTATGTANALVLTSSITPLAYAAGQEFVFLAASDNSGATTVNVDGLGVKSIVNLDASALVAGQIKLGGAFRIHYDGTNFQLINPNLKTVPGGGTGSATLAAHGLLIGNGTSAVTVSGAGTAGQVLVSNGPSADPTFQASLGPVLLATLTPTAAATVDALTTFTSTYDNYLILGSGITLATTDTLLMRLANAGVVDTGTSYTSALADGTNVTATSTTMSSLVSVFGGGKGISFEIRILNANDATNLKVVMARFVGQNATTPGWVLEARSYGYFAANAISGIRFYWNGGNNFAATGKIRIYGDNNS